MLYPRGLGIAHILEGLELLIFSRAWNAYIFKGPNAISSRAWNSHNPEGSGYYILEGLKYLYSPWARMPYPRGLEILIFSRGQNVISPRTLAVFIAGLG